MPKAQHTRLTWKGQFVQGTTVLEEWQVGLSTGWTAPWGDGTTAAADAVTFANGLFNDFSTTLLLQLPSYTRLLNAEFRAIGPDGRQLRTPAGAFLGMGISTTAPAAGGGAATAPQPPQSACVISLQTAKAGARGKGRFFLPAPGSVIGPDLRMTTVQVDNYRDAAKAFLDKVNTRLPSDDVAVFSSDGTPGAKVTTIRVGRAVDTQRRRRGDLLESYTTATLA